MVKVSVLSAMKSRICTNTDKYTNTHKQIGPKSEEKNLNSSVLFVNNFKYMWKRLQKKLICAHACTGQKNASEVGQAGCKKCRQMGHICFLGAKAVSQPLTHSPLVTQSKEKIAMTQCIHWLSSTSAAQSTARGKCK